MEKPLLLLALVPLAVGLVLISVAIGSKKTGKTRKRTLFACFLGAHGYCRRVDHREPTRMTSHVAARLPGYRPRPFHGSLRHYRNRTIAGLKPMRHLES